MAKRSTRNKLRYQAEQCIKKTKGIQQHLQYIDTLAQNRSEMINRSLPGLVEMSELLLDTLKTFREAL